MYSLELSSGTITHSIMGLFYNVYNKDMIMIVLPS